MQPAVMFVKTKTLGFASLSFDKFAPLYSFYWYNIPFAKENQLFFDNNFFYSTHRKSESFDSIHKWDDIYKIIEKEKMFIIYESSNSVLILLECFFYSDKELAKVKELIKEKMDAGKYKMLKNK